MINSKTSNYNNLLQIIALAVLYFVSGKLSLLFLHGVQIVNVGVFAAEGISLAFILYFGRSVWPGIFLGQFLLATNNDIPLMASFFISAINSMQAVFGYTIFNQYKLDIKLKTFKDIYGLILIILFIQFIGATLCNSVLNIYNIITSDNFISSSFSWWFGNIMGQLLITPTLLLIFMNYKKIDYIELSLYIVLFSLFVYFLEVAITITNPLLLLTFTIPAIIFTVSYKNFTYGAIFSVILALVSSYSVYLDIGAFSGQSNVDNAINYNLFILAHIFLVFITGTLFEERKQNTQVLEDTVAREIQKNKEQQLLLLQQSRLAQMGEMIAMIAHQWRQPLNNLSLVNQLLISKYQKGKLNDATIEHFKENSKKQITQMSTTIDDFRDFFKTEQQKSNFCVNEVIEGILGITQNIYATYGISLEFTHNTHFYTNGYSNALGQAILNIINNAKDALREKNIKNKSIEISLKERDNYVLILIKDNAGGIPEDIIDKVFDPYFSTKKSKNGTGLGLYMTKMIINEKLDGSVHFYNNNTNGTTFEISLKEANNVT